MQTLLLHILFANFATEINEVKFKNMKHKPLRITEKDFLLANRRASRAEEIEAHGKQISMRTVTHRSKKVYDRKRLKRAGINLNDDLPFVSQ